MPVTFDENYQYDFSPPQTIENCIRAYANWSGLHGFSFTDNYSKSSEVFSSAGAWSRVYYAPKDLPTSLLIEADMETDDGFGVILMTQNSNNDRWELRIRNVIAEIWVYKNGTGTKVLSEIVPPSAKGRIQVGLREMRMSDEESDVWHNVTLWVNNQQILTYGQYTGSVIQADLGFGLMGYGNTTFENIRVPQLAEYTEWSSLDPGETPIGGLNRSLEGRYVKYHLRHNREVYAWRGQSRPAAYTYNSNDYIEEQQNTIDLRGLYTHVRMLGAYVEATYFDSVLAARYGHRFIEVNNPYLMNTADCREQAVNEIRRYQERAFGKSLITSFVPIVEPEDRIDGPIGTMIVNNIKINVVPGQIEMIVNARSYLYGVE